MTQNRILSSRLMRLWRLRLLELFSGMLTGLVDWILSELKAKKEWFPYGFLKMIGIRLVNPGCAFGLMFHCI